MTAPENKLYWEIYRHADLLPGRHIFATLKQDVFCPSTQRTLTKGSRVRIWMASRFGDVGITGDLTRRATGYETRIGALFRHPELETDDWPLEDYLENLEIHYDIGEPVEVLVQETWLPAIVANARREGEETFMRYDVRFSDRPKDLSRSHPSSHLRMPLEKVHV